MFRESCLTTLVQSVRNLRPWTHVLCYTDWAPTIVQNHTLISQLIKNNRFHIIARLKITLTLEARPEEPPELACSVVRVLEFSEDVLRLLLFLELDFEPDLEPDDNEGLGFFGSASPSVFGSLPNCTAFDYKQITTTNKIVG